MRIKYIDLGSQWKKERHLLLPKIERLLESGLYIGGETITNLEEKLAGLIGTKYCVTVNSGTDALMFAMLMAGVKPGSEVITPANSFIASTGAIFHLGAVPVFADVLDNQMLDPSDVRRLITAKTSAIMPVHLTGYMADMESLTFISEEHGIPIIEDCAQAVFSSINGKKAGTWGKFGCFSAHPLKNLNAVGDAGFITSNDFEAIEKISRYKNHGLLNRSLCETFGLVSRLDALQAVFLEHRLTTIDELISKRRENASRYTELLNGHPNIFIPSVPTNMFHTYHTFVIQADLRDELKSYLEASGIETAIHYPIPIHLQPAFKKRDARKLNLSRTENQASKILSLPIHQNLTQKDVEYVSESIISFYRDRSF